MQAITKMLLEFPNRVNDLGTAAASRGTIDDLHHTGSNPTQTDADPTQQGQ
jgi:hypothetical protein